MDMRKTVHSKEDAVTARFYATAFVVVLSALLFPTIEGQATSIDERCSTATDQEIKRGKNLIAFWNEQLPGAVIEGRYSAAIDGCVALIKGDLQNEWLILDLYNVLVAKVGTRRGAVLFFCDMSGVDNVVVSKVRMFGGNVYDVSYEKYMDNGEGGLPRALTAHAPDVTAPFQLDAQRIVAPSTISGR